MIRCKERIKTCSVRAVIRSGVAVWTHKGLVIGIYHHPLGSNLKVCMRKLCWARLSGVFSSVDQTVMGIWKHSRAAHQSTAALGVLTENDVLAALVEGTPWECKIMEWLRGGYDPWLRFHGVKRLSRERIFSALSVEVMEQVEILSNFDQNPEVFDLVKVVLAKSHRFHPTGPPLEARLPGFLVPALTLSSSASVVDAAAEMTTLVEVLLKSWVVFMFFHGQLE